MADTSTQPTGESQYQALYRRYRPQRFEDVRGQEHVTRALLNAVREGRVSHAYLFSGPRGTGKTSTARILAMALNCEHPVDGEPDGTCASCVAIRQGSSLAVFELDAASNRKLDEMRDLLSRISLGTPGRWKVYIVDEVHQLTSDASSALLKTLEEPPPNVVFVLATTDPQRVLETIRSRTQHFNFHLLSGDVLAGLLRDVNRQAALGVAPEAIDLVVRRGHGSARDALSVLDQVAAAGDVEDEGTVVSSLVDALADRDPGRALVAVGEAMASGRDARRLGADVLAHLRNGFLALQARSLVLLPDDAVTEVAEQARRMGLAFLVRCMEVLGQTLTELRDSVDPRVSLEVALVRLASPAADHSPAALAERVERLERAVAGGQVVPGPVAAGPPQPSSSPGPGGPAPTGAPSPGPQPTPVAPTGPARSGLSAGPDPSTGAGPEAIPGRAIGPEAATAAAPGTGLDGPSQARAVLQGLRKEGGARPAPTGGSGAPAPAIPPAPRPVGPPPRPTAARPGGPPPSGPMGAAHPSANLAPGPQPGDAAPAGPTAPAPTETAAAVPPPRQAEPPRPPVAPAVNPPSPAPAGAARPDEARAGAARPDEARAGAARPDEALTGPPPIPPGPSGPMIKSGAAGTVIADPASSRPLPSRDELTTAWGDEVLPNLPPAAKVFLREGRFIEVTGVEAVFALPADMVTRADRAKVEAEKALAARFGRPIRLRLVPDPGVAAATSAMGDGQPPSPPAEEEPEDPDAYDLNELTDAGPGVLSAEQRLLEAFPGAEEVTP